MPVSVNKFETPLNFDIMHYFCLSQHRFWKISF